MPNDLFTQSQTISFPKMQAAFTTREIQTPRKSAQEDQKPKDVYLERHNLSFSCEKKERNKNSFQQSKYFEAKTDNWNSPSELKNLK